MAPSAGNACGGACIACIQLACTMSNQHTARSMQRLHCFLLCPLLPLICSLSLAGRATLRRVLLHWHEAAQEQACLGAMRQQADGLRRHTLLTAWLSSWRLATERSVLVRAREQQRQQRRLELAWQEWRRWRQDCVLRRGLDAAACLHRHSVLLRQCFDAWAQRVQACRQVDLPPQHPLALAAAQQQRRRVLRSFLAAWRGHLSDHVLPRMAQVQMRLLERFMGSQRRAFSAWQQYLQQRREGQSLKVGRVGRVQAQCLCHTGCCVAGRRLLPACLPTCPA